MESLNVKNINDEKIFNVIDPNGQGEVVNRIRPISVSINQKAQTINDQTDSTINLAVYWNDTWKSILDLTFDESLRQEYGKLTQDLTNIQKDIDMKQYKDAEAKTADFLKYVANLSSKYTAIPEKAVVSKIKNDFVKIKADKNSVKVAISDKLLNFMLKKYAKVDNLDYTKSNECFSTSKFNCLANNYDIYYHSPEIFQKQAYMTVVKDNKVVGSYKVNYDQFSKFASKFMLTPQKLGYSKDRLAGYMKTAEVVMQNIFFDSVDEAKEWQEMVDEKKKEQATTPEGEEETTETTTTETKTEIGEGKSESPIKEDGGLARPSEDFASDEIPESEPRQQEQQGGGQNLGASRRVNLLKKKASYTDKEISNIGYEQGAKDGTKAENRKNYNVVIGFDGKEEESDFAQEDVISALQEALIYFGEKWHELPSSLDNIDKLDFVKIREIEKGETVKEYTKEDILKMKEDFPKYSCNKKAIYGDVQEQDIVPAKTETKVYLQSEDNKGRKVMPGNKTDKEQAKCFICEKDFPISKMKEEKSVGFICNDCGKKMEEEGYGLDFKAYKATKIKKSATDYKGEVAEILDEINEPDILVDYISEDDAKKICKELNIPHEASWYKGDLRGYIDEIPDGMVDVLIEYISESDAEHIWRQIQHDMGNEASKKTNVQKKAEEQTVEEKIEEQVVDEPIKGTIGVGDIVAIDVEKMLDTADIVQYGAFIGKPMLLMETDKEDISKVIIEETEYPYQRVSIQSENIKLYDEVKSEQVIVEDVDGDEMITTFEELPVVAKQCKIKSIHKAANITKKKAMITKMEDRQFEFDNLNLLIDGKEEKCEGIIGIDIDVDLVSGVLPDGETSTDEDFYEIKKIKLMWLPELFITDNPIEFTDEEKEKIFNENKKRFEEYFNEEYVSILINEPGDEPW